MHGPAQIFFDAFLSKGQSQSSRQGYLKPHFQYEFSILGCFGQTGLQRKKSKLPCFPLINHYFYKKLRFYNHIPINNLELGFEFGRQRIRNLASSHVTIVCGSKFKLIHLEQHCINKITKPLHKDRNFKQMQKVSAS